MSIVLSVDIGSRNVGFAVAEIIEKRKLIVAESIYLEPKQIQNRLPILLNKLKGYIEQYQVSEIILEQPFLRGSNMTDVYYCTGLIYLVAGLFSLPVTKVSATEAKKIVTGSGKASKEEMELAARKYFSLNSTFSFESDHASDAAAFILCLDP